MRRLVIQYLDFGIGVETKVFWSELGPLDNFQAQANLRVEPICATQLNQLYSTTYRELFLSL